MRKLCVALTAALAASLMMPALTRPTAALTSAEAVDQANAYPNVGSIMVWRDANNPLGLPGGLAGQVDRRPDPFADHSHSGTLCGSSRELWNASALASNRRQLRSKCLGSEHMDRHQSRRGTCIAHPSFPRPCTPQSCPFDDTDGQYEPGISDVGLCFLDEPVLGIRPAKLANRSLDDKRVPGTQNDHRRLRNDGASSGRSG